MNIILLIPALLILAYLTGAIPTSVWAGRLFFKIDIREYGSGNAGATNTMRVLGLKTGIPVLVFDIFKGWLAVKYATIFNIYPDTASQFMIISILLGIVAVTGHIFPVYAGFRGGKGVASIFGVLLALSPLSTLCAAGIFIITLLVSKYVSVSSILAGISFPVWIILVFQTDYLSLKIFALAIAIVIIITHKNNIKRLFIGKESRAEFLFRKQKKEPDATVSTK